MAKKTDDFNEIMRLRVEKAGALRADGVQPYANDFRVDHTLDEVRAATAELDDEALSAQEEVSYAVGGRLIAVRSFGKAGFLRLRDRSGDLQVMAKRDRLGAEFWQTVVKRLDVGDIIGVKGFVFRTRTGELTIQATELALLTKSVRPLPEKFHGLTDKETRFRQRYVDLIVHPDVREIFRTRARVIRHIRDYFDGNGFLEVETPMMHTVPGGALAKPFKTFHNALGIPLYLRIAPELFLKRLVVGGLERVYEINRNFRNEGLSQRHNPEFTMLEFYEAFATFEDLMDRTEELVSGLVAELTGGTSVPFDGKTLEFAKPWRRLSVDEALLKLGGLDAAQIADGDALTATAKAKGLELRDGTPAGKVKMELFELLCEDQLEQPTFITHFPVAVSPLSRRNDANPEVVDRFELYVAGLEIANAFSELNDPTDQRARFEAQLEERAAGDDEAHEMDQDYLRALEYGLPPTAGEGIGIDRLVMLLTDQQSIREVLLFPHMRPETKGSGDGSGEDGAA